MQSAIRSLALEIEEANLHAVAYVVVFCKTHHEIRAAITQAPEDRFFPCPLCQQPSRYCLLGEGATRRAVPFFQEIKSRGRGTWFGETVRLA